MLFSVCQKCGCMCNENEQLNTVSIKEGNVVSHVSVCQKCYIMSMNESNSKLLQG